jgi:hypothetical protein
MADNKKQKFRDKRNTEILLVTLKNIVSRHRTEHLVPNYETEYGRNAVRP